ncbi:hypothetical protein BKA65DRAFT_145200 [Rhexocercosporidium sp. MPI-PUGE-AT-0058]|nr:hypothetical protein BKA65DRAFT_145200 [Rhexocercosporidium sp. MPI-PUGE-AT-0058]
MFPSTTSTSPSPSSPKDINTTTNTNHETRYPKQWPLFWRTTMVTAAVTYITTLLATTLTLEKVVEVRDEVLIGEGRLTWILFLLALGVFWGGDGNGCLKGEDGGSFLMVPFLLSIFVSVRFRFGARGVGGTLVLVGFGVMKISRCCTLSLLSFPPSWMVAVLDFGSFCFGVGGLTHPILVFILYFLLLLEWCLI